MLRRGVVEHEAGVRNEEIPLSVYIESVGKLARPPEAGGQFSAFFDGATKRNVIVGLFLAILELLRHHAFRAEQSADYGEIWVLPPINDTGAPLIHADEEQPASASDSP